MKRIGFLLSVLMFSLVLAGCDLIPTDVVEQATEELCREDPSNDLCQEDNVKNVEDQVILDLFNNVVSSYNNEDLQIVCEEYFSVSNVALLDRCRAGEEMFPEGIENFEAVSVEEQGDGYIVLMKNSETNQTFEFMIDVHGDVIAGLAIGAWSFHEKEDVNQGIEERLIVEQLTLFMADLENPELDNDEVCAVWYDGVDDDCDGFVEEARTKFKAGAELSKTVNILDPDSDDDGLVDATIEFDYHGHVTILKMSLMITTEGENVMVQFTDSEVDFTPNAETLSVLDQFMMDVMNPDLTDAEVCRLWVYSDGVDQDCDGVMAEARTKFKAGAELSKTVNIVDPDSDGDGLDDLIAMISSNEDGHVTVLKLSFTEEYTNGELDLVIHKIALIRDGGGDCDDTDCEVFPGEAFDVFEAYLEAYMNQEVSSDMLKTYFEVVPSEEYFAIREERLRNGVKLILVEVKEQEEDNVFLFVYDVENEDATARVTQRAGIIKSIDKASPLLMLMGGGDCDDDGLCDVISPDDVLELYRGYIDAYMNQEVSRDMLKAFFEVVPSETYFDLRDERVSNGSSLTLIDVIGPLQENVYMVVYDVLHRDIATRYYQPMGVVKPIDKATPLLYLSDWRDDDDDGDGILTAEEIDFLSSFTDDLQDKTMTIEEVCMKYVGEVDESCKALRSTAEGYQIERVDFMKSGMGILFRIRKRPDMLSNETPEIITNYMGFLYESKEGTRQLGIVEAPYFSIEEVLRNKVAILLENLKDETMPIDQVCMEVSMESADLCPSLRETYMDTDAMISEIKEVMVDGIVMHHVTIQYSMDGGQASRVFSIELVREGDMTHEVLKITEVR